MRQSVALEGVTARGLDPRARHHESPGRVSYWSAPILVLVKGWIARSEQRRALADLDDHLLRDIGRSRQEARRETAKWFWQR